MKKYHCFSKDLRSRTDGLGITILGLGGTGSELMIKLIKINLVLTKLQIPGLKLTAVDPGVVRATNVERQVRYYPEDIGYRKDNVLIDRINQNYDFDWQYHDGDNVPANITVLCTDNVKSRKETYKRLKNDSKHYHPQSKPFYVLDLGNVKNSGQVILSTVQDIEQPKMDLSLSETLRGPVDLFGKDVWKNAKQDEVGPSCSTMEAIESQDLFINSMIAEFGARLLWQLIFKHFISCQGYFINFDNFQINEIPIQ